MRVGVADFTTLAGISILAIWMSSLVGAARHGRLRGDLVGDADPLIALTDRDRLHPALAFELLGGDQVEQLALVGERVQPGIEREDRAVAVSERRLSHRFARRSWRTTAASFVGREQGSVVVPADGTVLLNLSLLFDDHFFYFVVALILEHRLAAPLPCACCGEASADGERLQGRAGRDQRRRRGAERERDVAPIFAAHLLHRRLIFQARLLSFGVGDPQVVRKAPEFAPLTR